MNVLGVIEWFSSLSIPQWVLLAGDVVVGVATAVVLALVFCKVLKLGALGIVLPLLVGSIMMSAAAWYETEDSERTDPTSVVLPTAQMDSQSRPLPMCKSLTGKMTVGSEEGYALAVGVTAEGDGGTTWYETAVRMSSDKTRFSVDMELGDADDRGRTYTITPIWMKKSHLQDLVENTRRLLDKKDVTYFVQDELPETSIAGGEIEVTRSTNTPC